MKISSKFDQVVAINNDSTLWTWGGYRFNQGFSRPARIDSNTNWKEISTGRGFAFGLKSDGTLWAWGENSFGQLGDGTTTNKWTLTRVTSDSNWVKVSCGNDFTVAIKSNGTVWAWGRNNYGQIGQGTNRINQIIPIQIGTDSSFIEISAGRDFTLLKKSNHSLWHVGACYSSSASSQLTQVGSSNDWATMSGGSYTNFAIKQNGSLYKFVSSNGRPSGLSRVGTASDWGKLDNSHTYSPEYHALFIKTNGTLWAMGDNRFGHFGTGNLISSSSIPIQVGTDTDWKIAVAGQQTSFGIKADNSFWAWGRNNYAQFGSGEHKNKILPVNNSMLWRTVELSSGSSYNTHCLAIGKNGTLWAWGQNNDGQLGNGSSYTHQALPIQIGADTTWKSITNGFHFSIAVKSDGTLWGWGRNGRSQLGLLGSFDRTIPTQIGSDTTWSSVSAGSEFVIALKENGTLWAWGYNYNGQIGNGTTTTTSAPIQIGTDSNWIKISAGGHHSLALKSDSSLWSWGSSQHGQIGRSGNKLIPMQVGTAKWMDISGGGLHSLAIQADSTMWAFGRNLYAQLGNNSTSSRNSPVQIGNAHKWKRVEAGYEHSIAIHSDSTLWTWGRSGHGELADSLSFGYKAFVPTKVSDEKWMGINAGVKSSAAIKSDGTIHTCGDGYIYDFQSNYPVLGYTQSTPLRINGCVIPCIETSFQFNATICQGNTYVFGSSNLSSSGIYKDTLINVSGCDSVVTLNLVVNPTSSYTDVIIACDSYTWIDGKTYISSNSTVKDTLINGFGCDSVISLNLTINQSSSFVDVVSRCDSFTWINGTTYTSSNFSAKDTLMNSVGCDSIISLNLTLGQTSNAIDVIHSCGPYTWIDGLTYTSNNNTAKDTLVNNSGCDSIITLNLTIGSSSSFTDVITACDSYTWIDGNTYTSSNFTAKDTLVNNSGCDSIITLNLTINQATSSVDFVTACDSYTWIDGKTYTSSNFSVKDTLTNNLGCDSIVTLNLTLGNTTYSVDSVASCGSYTWINGVTYTSSNSSAKDTLVNSSGCDSVVSLNLTITNIDNTVSVSGITLSSNETPASYQWLDCNNFYTILPREILQTYIPRFNGNYAVEITKNGCVDTSSCYLVNSVGIQGKGLQNMIKLFPNPTLGEFQLEFSSPIEANITLMDIQGKLIESRSTFGNSTVQFSLSSVQSGLYLVRIESKGKSIILMVVKE